MQGFGNVKNVKWKVEGSRQICSWKTEQPTTGWSNSIRDGSFVDIALQEILNCYLA